jgi:hypothetical protein
VIRWAAVLVLAAFSSVGQAQGIVTHPNPVRLRQLAGTVFDTSGATIPYAAIELRSAIDHHAIASTFADGYGKFFFDRRKPGETLEIRITLKGFSTVQYTVLLRRFGGTRLHAVLPAA